MRRHGEENNVFSWCALVQGQFPHLLGSTFSACYRCVIMAKIDITHTSSRQRDRPTVLVNMNRDFEHWPVIVKGSRALQWRLLDLRYRQGTPEPDLVPQGAIVQQLPNDPLVRKLLKMGCPVVRVGMLPHPKDVLVPAVMPDFGAAGALAAEHFFERGFKHLGYVGFKPWSARKGFYDGFKKRARELGCNCHLLRFESGTGGDTKEEIYYFRQRLVGDWLRDIPKPFGLLGYVDGMAGMLCCMCRDAGYIVPEEIAVLGCRNILSSCEGSIPTLSSIDLDEARVTETALQVLDQLMQGKTLPKTTVMIPPPRVVTRESTDLLAVADLDVARALRYMWNHIDQDLGVDDVVAEVGVSRRSITRRFRDTLGRSIIEELLRKRLSEARRLLRTTDEPVVDIAVRVGFRSATYLHRTFREAHGMTPRQYRMQQGGGGARGRDRD
jgi:LacI family transcriptional regulator